MTPADIGFIQHCLTDMFLKTKKENQPGLTNTEFDKFIKELPINTTKSQRKDYLMNCKVITM